MFKQSFPSLGRTGAPTFRRPTFAAISVTVLAAGTSIAGIFAVVEALLSSDSMTLETTAAETDDLGPTSSTSTLGEPQHLEPLPLIVDVGHNDAPPEALQELEPGVVVVSFDGSLEGASSTSSTSSAAQVSQPVNQSTTISSTATAAQSAADTSATTQQSARNTRSTGQTTARSSAAVPRATAGQTTTSTSPTTRSSTTTTTRSTTTTTPTTQSTTTTTPTTQSTTTTTSTTRPQPDPDRTPGETLIDVDFENQATDEYTRSEMDADFNWVGNWTNGLDQGRTNIAFENGNNYLRLLFKEGTRGHVQWQADLGGAHDDVYLQYNVRFEDNGNGFDFRDGGKLPGLAGGTAPTGGAKSSDGLGYSARFMWRDTNSNPDAYFTQYMYDMDKRDGSTGRHVTLGGSPIYVQTNHWYTIKSRIVMNTPGRADGIIQAWLDGQLVLDIRNASLRSSADLGTDILYFSTFFGGSNNSQYRTSKDEYIDYDNFKVWLGD